MEWLEKSLQNGLVAYSLKTTGNASCVEISIGPNEFVAMNVRLLNPEQMWKIGKGEEVDSAIDRR